MLVELKNSTAQLGRPALHSAESFLAPLSFGAMGGAIFDISNSVFIVTHAICSIMKKMALESLGIVDCGMSQILTCEFLQVWLDVRVRTNDRPGDEHAFKAL